MTVTKTKASINYDRLVASVCRDSFFEFFKRFWHTIAAGRELICNWHIEYLCNEIQATVERVMEGRPSLGDLFVNIPPGTSKSSICSIMLPAWVWTRDLKMKMIYGSHTDRLSHHFGNLTGVVLTSELYRRLFPEVELRKHTESVIINTQGGQRYATSIGAGNVLGQHGDFIVLDDPVDPSIALSEADMNRANFWIDHTLMSRRISGVVSPLIIIMQRLHQNDPTGYMMSKGNKYQHICLPAEATDAINPPELIQNYTDGIMDPLRHPKEELEQIRQRTTEFGYASQYLQTPIPLEGAMFRVGRITIVDHPPPLVRAVRYWDNAGTGGGGAYTVGLKMGVTSSGQYCVLDVVRGQWEAFEREERKKQTAILDGRGVRIGQEQEPGSSGKEVAMGTVQRLAGYSVMIDRPTGDKITRADAYATQVNAGNVCLVKAPWNREYLQELEYFPNSRYKDQVDASSGAFSMLTRRVVTIGGLGARRT